MKFKNLKIKNLNMLFSLIIIYQIIAIVSVLGCYPSDIFYSEFSIYGLVITFPISCISFMIRFAEKDTEMTVIIIQSIIFLLSVMPFVLLKRKIKKSNISNPSL